MAGAQILSAELRRTRILIAVPFSWSATVFFTVVVRGEHKGIRWRSGVTKTPPLIGNQLAKYAACRHRLFARDRGSWCRLPDGRRAQILGDYVNMATKTHRRFGYLVALPSAEEATQVIQVARRDVTLDRV